MDEAIVPLADVAAPRRNWGRIALRAFGAAVLALGLLVLAVFVFVQTDTGRQFAARQVSGMTFGNGLRIEVGRIDGSLLGKTRLLDVVAYDTKGRFLSAPAIDLDWRPLAYLGNHVDVRSASAALVTLERVPQFKVSTTKGPLLPDLDIDVGHLQIDRLVALPAVAGERRELRLASTARIARARESRIRLERRGGSRASDRRGTRGLRRRCPRS